jgi:hypothetical protein
MSGAIVALGAGPEVETELRGHHESLYAFHNCAVRHTVALGGLGLTTAGRGYSTHVDGKMKLVCVDPECQVNPRVA